MFYNDSTGLTVLSATFILFHMYTSILLVIAFIHTGYLYIKLPRNITPHALSTNTLIKNIEVFAKETQQNMAWFRSDPEPD